MAHSILRLFAFLICTSATVCAGELKVDINRDSKNLDSVTEVGYLKWSADASNAAATGTNAVSRSFTTATGESVIVTFAQTAASAAAGGTGLLSNWYQTGAQGASRLVSDGITVAPANLATGGQLRMTITGLAAGSHTLLTYHNAWDALAAGSLGPIDIHVNNVLAVNNLQPSIRAASNSLAASAYLGFEVAGPTDTATFLFAAEASTGPGVTIRNAMINGFEIDTPNSIRIALSPSPADADEHVDADSGTVTLAWSPALAGNIASHDVYLGTDRSIVKSATRSSPTYLGNQSTLSRTVPVTDPYVTYYWRIDEIDSLGNVTAGPVWYFRPRHLAFPGAEGYGRFARGGRGGKVVHVTSLADYATNETPIPGTLRHAITVETGPRVIVFDVGGIIDVKSRLVLSSPYVTIAGQTAPGKGICLKTWALGLSGANDAVIRFLRSRPGRTLQTITVDRYKNGAIGTPITATAAVSVDGMGMQGSFHSIIDHCSISWTIDEAFSSRSAKNITLQRTLISEALNKALHPNYVFLDDLAGAEHGYAASVGGDIGSFHHNLLAHCYGRNWSLAGGLDASATFAGRLDFTNNVVYNWGSRTTDGGAMEVDFVGNYYKPGPGTTLVPYALTMNHEDNFAGSQRCYFAGNVMPGYFDEANQNAGRRRLVSSGVPTPTYETFVAAPFFPSYVTTQTARSAYKQVLSDVGCNRPLLDDHDTRIIRETRDGTYTYTGSVTGKHGFPDAETDVGGWEDYPSTTRPAAWDTDSDGLPNWWEIIHGTNTASPAGDFTDANADPDGDGYTQLDDYLAWLALPRLETTTDTPVDLDLSTLTNGYTSALVRQVAGASGGSIQLLPDGKTARFTPNLGFTGLARFTHTVTDTVGDTMTGEVGVHISTAPDAPTLTISAANGALSLWFTGSAGLVYTLQYSTDLLQWINIQTIAATGTMQAINVPGELLPAPRLFFRAIR